MTRLVLSRFLLLLYLLGVTYASVGERQATEPTEPTETNNEEVETIFDAVDSVQNIKIDNKRFFLGRLQIYTGDNNTPRCVKIRKDFEQKEVLQGACAYVPRHMFIYDSLQQHLFSQAYPDMVLNMRFEDRSPYKEQYFLEVSTLAELRQLEDVSYHIDLEPRVAGLVTLFDKHDVFGMRHCLQAPEADGAKRIYAVPLLSPEVSQCSKFTFIPTTDDEVEGHIRVFAPQSSAKCVTYQTGAKQSSVLGVDSCERGPSAYQLFMYNQVTGHLKWKQTPGGHGPYVFMWWSGPLRAYDALPAVDMKLKDTYSWDIRMGQHAAVFSRDPRGYSGSCWMVQNKQIVANQTCSYFRFVPTQPPRVLRRLRHTGVVIKARLPGSDKVYCVNFAFDLQFSAKLKKAMSKHSVQGENIGRIMSSVLKLADCPESPHLEAENRFIMSTAEEDLCQKSGNLCAAHLRWGGDPRNSLIWMRTEFSELADQNFLTPRSGVENSVPGTWLLSTDTWHHIEASDVRGCWSTNRINSKKLRFDVTGKDCVQFMIEPVKKYFNVPENVTLVSQFLGRANARVFVDYEYPNLPLLPMEKRVKVRKDLSNRYFADTGFFGDTRIHRDRRGRLFRGSLILNFRYWEPAGVSTYFLHSPTVSSSSTGLIRLAFSAVSFMMRPTNQSYFLFSFRRHTGCDVYITSAGHLGMNCYTPQMHSCQIRFRDGFSLLDGRFHSVALMYSTSSAIPSRFYVDYQMVGECAMPSWNMAHANNKISFFHDTLFWGFTHFPIQVQEISLYTGAPHTLHSVGTTPVALVGERQRFDIEEEIVWFEKYLQDREHGLLEAQEEGEFEDLEISGQTFDANLLGLDLQHQLQQVEESLEALSEDISPEEASKIIEHQLLDIQIEVKPIQAIQLGGFKTKWENCRTLSSSELEHVGRDNGVTCDLAVVDEQGSSYVVPMDAFSLGCSRPRCEIFFAANQPIASNRFRFIYLPRYPDSFASEDVGNLRQFSDMAILTDGFSRGTASFQVAFEASDLPEGAVNALEVSVSDVNRYRCKQNCCATVQNHNEPATSETF